MKNLYLKVSSGVESWIGETESVLATTKTQSPGPLVRLLITWATRELLALSSGVAWLKRRTQELKNTTPTTTPAASMMWFHGQTLMTEEAGLGFSSICLPSGPSVLLALLSSTETGPACLLSLICAQNGVATIYFLLTQHPHSS